MLSFCEQFSCPEKGGYIHDPNITDFQCFSCKIGKYLCKELSGMATLSDRDKHSVVIDMTYLCYRHLYFV